MGCPSCGNPFAGIIIGCSVDHNCTSCGTWYEEADESARLVEVIIAIKEKIKGS